MILKCVCWGCSFKNNYFGCARVNEYLQDEILNSSSPTSEGAKDLIMKLHRILKVDAFLTYDRLKKQTLSHP